MTRYRLADADRIWLFISRVNVSAADRQLTKLQR